MTVRPQPIRAGNKTRDVAAVAIVTRKLLFNQAAVIRYFINGGIIGDIVRKEKQRGHNVGFQGYAELLEEGQFVGCGVAVNSAVDDLKASWSRSFELLSDEKWKRLG